MGLKDRLEEERKKTGEDVEWALNRNPEAANKAMKFMRSSLAVKLAVILGIVGTVYYSVTALSTNQLLALTYVLVGSGVARYSDYSWMDWEAYLAVVAWLPIVLYSFLPDKLRVEK